jgi:hypothetical protein
MSHFEVEHDTSGPVTLPWERFQQSFLIAGGAGVALCGVAALFDRPAA